MLFLLLLFRGQGPVFAAATHRGTSDASTAIPVDEDYMFIGDDESQVLRLYLRHFDGLPVRQQDFTANLGLTDFDKEGKAREVDIEASVRVGDRVYWLGSHSNCGGCDPLGELRPNRNRLFATDVAGAGANARLTYVGRYDNLKRDLINWDNANGHGLGARFLQLSASAAAGVEPEDPRNIGFNIEGFTMAPTGTVVFLGFRSPLTPSSGRSNALVIPVLNLPQLVLGNPARGPAKFGHPMELALEGRGIRSMDSSSNGVVLIAGPTTNGGPFSLFTWTGQAEDPPREHLNKITVPRPEGLIAEGGFAVGSVVQLISEGAGSSSSEYLTLGPILPAIRAPAMTDRGADRLTVLGHAGGRHDIEVSDTLGHWQFLASVLVPAAGQLDWTNSVALTTRAPRFYRLRYPSRF